MATPLPGPSGPVPHKGGAEPHDSLLRMVLGAGLCQLDDDVLTSLVSHDPLCLSLSGGSLDYSDSPQASGSHGIHVGSPQDVPLHRPAGTSACAADDDLAVLFRPHGLHVGTPQYVPLPDAAASSQGLLSSGLAPLPGSHGYHVGPTPLADCLLTPACASELSFPFPLGGTASSMTGQAADGGWAALDLFQNESYLGAHNLPSGPALPDVATSYGMVPPLSGGARDTAPCPSVGSADAGSPQNSLAGAGGTAGAASMPLAADPDLLYKEKQRAAQRRFRDRQRDKMRNTQKQVEELSEKMNSLLSEKAALESRNRVLEQVVKLNIDHEKKLHCHREIMSREQELLLEELAAFRARVEAAPPPPLSVAKAWTMTDWMESLFPRYMQRLRTLLLESKGDDAQASAAETELHELVSTRGARGRRALFSCFYPAVYSWNQETMTQAGLALTPEQEARLLEARAALLEALRGLAEERRGLLAGLALELLACPRDQWHRCGGLQRLLRSLGQERAAVHTFLFSVCDEIMTPQQEAFLDTESYPWCPDVWGLVGALAAASKGPAGRDLGKVPGLEAGGTAFGPLMPLNTAFQLLKAPLLAKGLGLRLKCGILMDPYLTVVPSSAFPTTSVAQLAGMSIYDVHCGKYRSTQFQEWLHVNLPGHSQLTALIPH